MAASGVMGVCITFLAGTVSDSDGDHPPIEISVRSSLTSCTRGLENWNTIRRGDDKSEVLKPLWMSWDVAAAGKQYICSPHWNS